LEVPLIRALGFDADDTLWHNEDHFAATEDAFADLLSRWATPEDAKEALLATETQNLELFGYGVKSFTLSMIEAAMELSGGAIEASDLVMLLERGKAMLARPAELLPGVEQVLSELAKHYFLIVITKGDLHHQERKVQMSGVAHFFNAIEVISEKDPNSYARLLDRHNIIPSEFVMIGNSVKSDVLPVVHLGGIGVHIPYTFTWAHEHAHPDHELHTRNVDGARYWELDSIREVPELVQRLAGS
jgi:putative hydrolase of the HAD superfamily